MEDEKINTEEAARILGYADRRAALVAIKSAGIPIEYRMAYDRFRYAVISKAAILELAQKRGTPTPRRGRPPKNRTNGSPVASR